MWCADFALKPVKRAHELETNLRPATVRRYERHETDLRCRFGLRRVLHANKLYRFHRCQPSRPSVVRNANDRPSRSEDESRSRRFATNPLGQATLHRSRETQRGSHGPYRCPTPTVSVRQHFEESKDDGISWATWFDGTYRRTTNEPRLQVEPRNQRRGQLPHAGWPDNSLLSSPVMHPWSTGWRCVGAVTAVATIVAGLISMDHHAESRHEICEEHGELVHVRRGRAAMRPDELLSDEQQSCQTQTA